MLPVFTILIVFFSFFRIAQHFISLVNLLKFFMSCCIIRIYIGMKLPGKALVGPLDVGKRRAPLAARVREVESGGLVAPAE